MWYDLLILLLNNIFFFFFSLQSAQRMAAHTKIEKTRHQITYLLTEAEANKDRLEEKWREGARKRIEGRRRYGYI